MSKKLRVAAMCLAIISTASISSLAAEKAQTMQEIIDTSSASDWRDLDPNNTLYMQLESGLVVIELAPEFAPKHVANIRTLATEHFWDGLSIYRSQDNFVVQWGDSAEDPKDAKSIGSANAKLPAEFSVTNFDKKQFHALPDKEGWSKRAGFVQGFPAATNGKQTWLAHCYATLGAGRGNEADSSNGTELYAVTGQSPRQLDRNITVVGHIWQGMEYLSVITRGAGPGGFYENPKQSTPIQSIRLASTVPVNERIDLEVFRTDTKTFDTLVESRRNRSDDWYLSKADYIDLCNIPVPVRVKK